MGEWRVAHDGHTAFIKNYYYIIAYRQKYDTFLYGERRTQKLIQYIAAATTTSTSTSTSTRLASTLVTTSTTSM